MIRVTSAEHAASVLADAMARRWRVTVGFREVERDDKRRPVKGADGNVRYVQTVRTMEFFDVVARPETDGTALFTGMDACPRDGGGPAIRAVRADRITDITVHRRCPYRMVNMHFVGRVRAHASDQAGEGWGEIAALSDTDLWALIDTAHNPEEAIGMAAAYADA